MCEPIRVLQCVNIMNRAGLETMLMNYYRNIDKTKIQFDFLTHRSEKGAYDDEILSMGGKIYYAPRLMPQNFIKYRKFMKDFFRIHPEYKIIHSHIDTMSYFPLKEAKRNNIKFRIAHSHTSKLDKDYKLPIKFYAKLFIKSVSNVYLSCGEVAGKFLFGKSSFKIVNNAIDLKKFKYNNEIRNNKRKEFNLSDNTFVVGHVGRYIYIKNQLFLLDIFKEILKVKSDSCLVLVGSGPDEEKILNKIKEYKIEDKVLLLKDRSDVDQIYQIMDVFVMPSLFEGLPLVAVEAQANGIKCVLSDKISCEAVLISSTRVVSLSTDAHGWCDVILDGNCNRNPDSIEQLQNKGFDITLESKKLENYYIELLKKGGF